MARRVATLSPSPTLAITARAMAMRSAGEDVVSFAAGEPDFQTPEPIVAAAYEAMKSGFTKYTAGAGIRELREVVAEKLWRENQIQASVESVVISCGAKHALIDAILGLVDPGDEVVIVAPYWMSYSEQVVVAGGIPVLAHCRPEDDFEPDPDVIEAAISPRTKAVMICSPNNPTGAVWPRDAFLRIAEIADRHGLWIISDEVYEKLIYEGEHFSPAGLSDAIAEKTITIGSCSKTYAMTGWRIGYMTGPLEAMRKIACVQDTISHPASFAQRAAIAAFEMGDEALDAMRTEYRLRRDLMFGEVGRMPGVKARLPKGAFYVFADFSAYLGGKFIDDMALAEYLLQTAKVAIVPGSVFAAPSYLRLSYAASQEDIRRGTGRIAEALVLSNV